MTFLVYLVSRKSKNFISLVHTVHGGRTDNVIETFTSTAGITKFSSEFDSIHTITT